MTILDIILLLVVGAAVFFAVRAMRRNRGKCCGDCAACGRCQNRNP